MPDLLNERFCRYCNKRFMPRKPYQEFDSPSCRMRYWRKNHGEAKAGELRALRSLVKGIESRLSLVEEWIDKKGRKV